MILRAWRRRLATVALATGLAGSGIVGTAPAALAAPTAVTNASFEWSWNDYVQTFTGPCHWLSAGALPVAGTFDDVEGGVTILKYDGSPVTNANKCTTVDGFRNNKARWTGGTGTIDAATGEVSLTFTGSMTVMYNDGGTPYVITNPVVTVDAAGVGTVVATSFSQTVASVVGTAPNLKLADLTGVASANSTGFTTTPKFFGVTVDADPGPGTSLQPLAGSGGTNGEGSWTEPFVQFIDIGGQAFFYTTGPSLSNVRKAPNPITVTYDAGPAPIVPEAPMNLLLPLGGGAVVAGVLYYRRRSQGGPAIQTVG